MADPLPPPAWFTPRRLLAIFCAVNILLYLDRGLFASNGVNGSPRTPEAPAGSGIQVRSITCVFIERAIDRSIGD